LIDGIDGFGLFFAKNVRFVPLFPIADTVIFLPLMVK